MQLRHWCSAATSAEVLRCSHAFHYRPFIGKVQISRIERQASVEARRYSTNPRERSIQTRKVLNEFKEVLQFPPADCSLGQLSRHGTHWIDRRVVLHGYIGTRRVANKGLVFAELHDISLSSVIQVVSATMKDVDSVSLPHQLLQDLENHTPVAIEGTIKGRQGRKSGNSDIDKLNTADAPVIIDGIELKLENIKPLNHFPADLMITAEKVFPPEQRHMQIRHDRSLRNALTFRSKVARFIRDHLADNHGFEEFETPMLFKSTPEGAREFLVPTRAAGLAYALPQSPQQYKQILMASGIPRYMQIARCFRDEDLRADRQPEFTQVDLEMAFASGEDVMRTLEDTVRALWGKMLDVNDLPNPFPRMTYEEAMSKYGSDKPDTRLGSEIRRIDYMLPVDLVLKLGPLTDPIVDVMKIRISNAAVETKKFVDAFMDSPEAQSFIQNPDGQPGIFVFDARKPLQGLQPFGFEAANQIEDMLELEDGDLIVLQARKNKGFSGGSTPMGNLRLTLHRAAVKQGFLPAPKGFSFCWINDFPLFSPANDTEPGQGGISGLVSTHHPFTAPKTLKDIDLLLSSPLEVKADHYDLVVNGVELGGGSRRIHNAKMQELIMREVLQMSDERMKDFEHLIEVLRAGCPPHAGIALGFDRLMAIMLERESVRDVIAFPKSGKGEDLLVKSPSKMTEAQLKTYHLKLRNMD